jgi:hypothetical protein
MALGQSRPPLAAWSVSGQVPTWDGEPRAARALVLALALGCAASVNPCLLSKSIRALRQHRARYRREEEAALARACVIGMETKCRPLIAPMQSYSELAFSDKPSSKGGGLEH